MPHDYNDLAKSTFKTLKDNSIKNISLKLLENLFQAMYYSTLQTEESERHQFHFICIDPTNHDPEPPQRIVRDRWQLHRLTNPIPVTESNILKIASASNPRSSSFAVWPSGKSGWNIHGIIDQQNRFHDYVNHDSESGTERPGLFEVIACGPGHLIVNRDYKRVAELKINRLVPPPVDVFRNGDVLNSLQIGLSGLLKAVVDEVGKDALLPQYKWENTIPNLWIATLCRLILRVQKLKHGGAFLITKQTAADGLNIKYPILYDRIKSALERYAISSVRRCNSSNDIFDAADDVEMDSHLFWEYKLHNRDYNESLSEIDGAIWFSSLLSRVDGLVLVSQDFVVRGFGVEITVSSEPSNIYVASSIKLSERSLQKFDFNHFGTRHRSMMRYCNENPEATGIVISQDGGIRVIKKVKDKLILWDNVKLKLYDIL